MLEIILLSLTLTVRFMLNSLIDLFSYQTKIWKRTILTSALHYVVWNMCHMQMIPCENLCNVILLILHSSDSFSMQTSSQRTTTGADEIVMSYDPKKTEEAKGSLDTLRRKYFLPKDLENATPEEIWSWWQKKGQQENLQKNAIISSKVSDAPICLSSLFCILCYHCVHCSVTFLIRNLI